jgi:formylglycine-generating enzyme required for sulfatase activity
MAVVIVGDGGCRRSEPSPPPMPRPADDMVSIPAGPFRAGCDARQGCEFDGRSSERPIHDATLPAYEIDRLEVSVDDFRACWRDGHCKTANDQMLRIVAALPDDGKPPHVDDYEPWPIMDPMTNRRLPMWDVTAYEARAYCAWVGKRLPTALEWEKAARGTDGRAHPWGNEPPTGERTSNAVSDNRPSGFPLAVGSQPAGASPYGVLDMVGNVAEYVERDDHDLTRIRVAGPHPRLNERMRPGLTVLPGIGEGRTLYHRTPDMYLGFRCARSLRDDPRHDRAR